MYKLTIVAGPNRGSSYAIQDGETSIGRQSGNSVVLQSGRVSKRHCVLVVSDGQIVVRDEGSSNGTFINGVLKKSSAIKPGDRISVGDVVLEVSDPNARGLQAAPAFGNVLKFPVAKNSLSTFIKPEGDSAGGSLDPLGVDAVPKDLVGKAKWMIEHQVMPIFYAWNFKTQWRALSVGLFGIFLLANLVISVYPLVEQNKESLSREAAKRARFIAKDLVQRNTPFIAARQESKTEIGAAENAEGVRLVVITDMDNRVIAPASKSGSVLAGGDEAIYALKARDAFRNGRESGMTFLPDSETVLAVEPIRVASTTAGKNVTIGMAVVSIDTSLSNPSLGDDGVVYSETLILTALLGSLVLFLLYRITLKPLEVLSDDLNKALKGDIHQVTHEFKFEEIDSLWDMINSALQRMPKSQSSPVDLDLNTGPAIDEYLGPMRMMGETSPHGLIVLDSQRKIAYMNPSFEELSGVRADSSVGQEIGAVARDQSLGAFITDLLDRVAVGNEGLSENYEFSGVTYQVKISAFGSPGTPARCYLMAALRVSE